MPKKYRIVIAEDHTILREGLKMLLSADPDLEVVGEAQDGREAVRSAEKLLPDVILMDLSMPRVHGLEAIREIRKRAPDTRILVLTVHSNNEYITATLEAGAHGYVLKDATSQELLIAIKTVLRGKPYLSPSISETILEGYLQGTRTLKVKSAWDTLTARERETLKLIAEGYKTKEIADFLGISAKTAEKHRANLMRKLDLHSVSAVTAFAAQKGLIGG